MRLLADENFNNSILRGLLRVDPTIDIVCVQDTPVICADDPTVLEWASQEQRVLLTHDVNTGTNFACERVKRGLLMPGVIEVGLGVMIGQTVQEILLIIQASKPDELENRIIFVPL